MLMRASTCPHPHETSGAAQALESAEVSHWGAKHESHLLRELSTALPEDMVTWATTLEIQRSEAGDLQALS